MNSINYAAHGDQRVAVFIDTQNLYHSARANFRSNVNYQELMEQAVNGRKLIRAFAYVIKSEESTEEKFFDAIQEIGIEIRVKDLQVFHTGAKKADWDVGIAVDMIRLTEKVDVVVLASGDGDFLEVVRYCKSRGVRVEVMAFEKTTNSKLMEEVDNFVDLGDRNSHFLISNKRRATTARNRYSGYEQNAELESNEEDFMPAAPPKTNINYDLSKEKKTYENSSSSLYGGSNLSSVNRNANQNNQVNPSIFSRNNSGNRKIKPVVGLPIKPKDNSFQKPVLINDQTKKKLSLENVFGNSDPKTIKKKLF